MDAEDATQPTQAPPEVPDISEPQPVIMIKAMELINFKSYANTVMLGPFDRHMTSVVGPNGSGKSNVIDAMLFVFGFKAKQMRQSKVSELIHSSEDYKNLDFAKVSVIFQSVIDHPDGTFTVVPGSEFVVTRQAKRDNSSSYWIDKKPSDYAKVTAFLRTKGIDLDHNRFLILQGEVESIAMMSPSELLDYLEDIIGSNKLIPKIEESHKAIEVLNEERATKLNTLKASSQQVASLEPRREAAEAYLATEAQLNGKKSAYFQKMVRASTAAATEAEAAHAEIEATLKEERDKAAGQREELSTLEKAHKKKKKEHDKCAEQLDASRKEFQAFEREDIKHREEVKAAKNQLKKAKDGGEKEAKRLGEAKAELKKAKEDIPELEEKAAAITATQTKAQAELEKMYEALDAQTAPIRVKIEAAQKKREPDAQALTAVQAEEALLISERELIEKKVAEGVAEREKAQAELSAHVEATKRSKEEYEAVMTESADLESRLAAAQAGTADASKLDALIAEEKTLRAKYTEGREQASATTGSNRVLEALMKEKKAGRMSGVIGRLGSLATVDKKYDVAASTCCGALDNILVADTPTAQSAVAFLREKSLGVATFIILDKQGGGDDFKKRMESYDAPEGSSRLFDLLNIKDDAHRPAFYSAFRDTLVCDNDDKGKKIAQGTVRRRVVTTSGVLFETVGTLSGGGKPRSGRIGPSVADGNAMSDKELSSLLKQADELSAKIDALKQESNLAQNAVANLQRDAKKNVVHTKKLKMQIDAADEKRAALEARVARAADAGALGGEEEARKAALDKEVKAIGKRLAAAQSKVDAADETLKKLNEQVLQVGGTPLLAKKTQVEDLGGQLNTIEERLTKAKAQAEASEKTVTKIENAAKKAADLAVELEAKIEKLKAGFKTLEDDAMVVMQKYEACQAELSAKEEELLAIQKDFEAAKAVVAGVRKAEGDLEAKLEDRKRTAKKAASEVKMWQNELEALRETVQRDAEKSAAEAAAVAEAAAAAGEPIDMDETGAVAVAEAGSSSGDQLGVHDLSEDELAALDAKELEAEMKELDKNLKGMTSDLGVLAEYKQRAREHSKRTADFDEVTSQRDAQRAAYEALRAQRLSEFMEGFVVIGTQLKAMYQMITLGGDAELDLVDSLDPFTEGIRFSVRPPKKSWKNISNLSGGEKTLSSLALVFALHHYKPTPLYVMDEIDAALDFRNVSIVGNYIKERTRNAQFVIISLRNNMFELADRLVGIYKTQGSTKSIAIDPAAFTIAAR